MTQRVIWSARVILVGLVAYGALRVADLEERWAAARVRGDRLEHALLVYALTVCLLAAFPRLKVRVVVGGMLALGLGLELVQALPFVTGAAQVGDVAADVVGVLLAALPFLAGRARTARADAAG
jgi:VanZ family protein